MASCFQTWTVLPQQPIEIRAHLERRADEPGLRGMIVSQGKRLDSDPRAELRSALDAS